YMSTTSPQESLPAMNNVDLGQYKRIVQYFWDPEPKNNEEPGSPIWCLGREHGPLKVNHQRATDSGLHSRNDGGDRSQSSTDSQPNPSSSSSRPFDELETAEHS